MARHDPVNCSGIGSLGGAGETGTREQVPRKNAVDKIGSRAEMSFRMARHHKVAGFPGWDLGKWQYSGIQQELR